MDWKTVNFDWNRARAFLAAAEEGSLSAASRALGVTQPTLGRQVAALEEELGLMLFERLGSGLELTESGLQLLAHAKNMGDAAIAFSLAASGQAQAIEGSVVISASESDAAFRLPAIIALLRKTEPGIEIEVVVTNEPSDLKRREADIALRSFRPKQPDLIARKLGDERIWLYGTEDYLKQFGQPKTTAEIEGVQFMGFDRGGRMTDMMNAQGWNLTEKNFPVITKFHLLQWELIKQGLGVGFFPETVGDADASVMRAFEQFGAPVTIPMWLVCHQELRTSLRVRRVFDVLADELSKALSRP